jgi:tellurite methyltransferase
MSEFLKVWSSKAPLGRALDIGAGVGNHARWLAARGFEVDAVESHPKQIEALRQAVSGTGVVVHEVDIRQFDLPPQRYSLIIGLAVFHFIASSDMTPLASRLQASLEPGGLLLAQVFTVDDPGYQAARQLGLPEIEPNTFEMDPPANLIHYFEMDELPAFFSQLEVLHYTRERVLAPDSEAGYRAGAALVARKQDIPDDSDA